MLVFDCFVRVLCFKDSNELWGGWSEILNEQHVLGKVMLEEARSNDSIRCNNAKRARSGN